MHSLNLPENDEHATITAIIMMRQAELGISDEELCKAVDIEKVKIWQMIKEGQLRVPLNRIRQLADALGLVPFDLLRLSLKETHPDLLKTIDDARCQMQLTDTEKNLIMHLRGLCGDAQVAPVVFDGRTVVALVTA